MELPACHPGEARAQEAIRRAQQEQAAIAPFWMVNGSMIPPAKLHKKWMVNHG